jgi:hypothetical protein
MSDRLESVLNKLLACLGLYGYITEAGNEENILSERGDDIDKEMLQILQEDLKHTHTEILQAFSDLSNKNTRVLQFTGTVFAVVAAGATAVDDVSTYINKFTVTGFIFLTISILILLYLSRTNSIPAGAGKTVMREAIGAGESGSLDEKKYRLWVCKKYTDWIEKATKQNRTKACRLRVAETLTIAGIGLLIAGILIPIL